jgi:hypothetical protein
MERRVLGEGIFYVHTALVFFWYGLFLVPAALWPEKISFHFFFSLAVVGHQFVWGAVLMPWTKKYKMACALTTAMQSARGYKITEAENHDYSCIKEFMRRAGLDIPKNAVTVLTLTTFTIVSLQYFFGWFVF